MKEEIIDIKRMLSNTDYETSFNANATCSHRLLNYITNIEEENKRLNNIISELGKWLKEMEEYESNIAGTENEKWYYSNVYDYLQKLKRK